MIVGWSESDKRRGFRSLLLAARDDRKLTYVGKVGTGFSGKLIEELMERMEPLEIDKAPVEVPRAERKGAHWIKPKLVAEIAFTEFTAEGILRHPSFIALREDKPAKEVVREVPKHLPSRQSREEGATHADRRGLRDRDQQPRPRDLPRATALTKGELADYYAAVEPLIMVDAAKRPMTLIRCPQGRAEQVLFPEARQRHLRRRTSSTSRSRRRTATIEDYLYFDDIRGLLACVQMGTIEFHGWGSKVDKVEYPDRLVFDLDPDVGPRFRRR